MPMEALAQNNRSFVTAASIMLVVAAAIVALGVILFPLNAYDNPNAGPIPGLLYSPGGNILVIAMFGLLAANIGVFLNTVTRLERERAEILEQSAATVSAHQIEQPRTPQAIERPER